MRVFRQIALVACIGLVALTVGTGGQSHPNAESMRGMPGMRVTVEELSADVEQRGLHGAEVQTDVEFRLRRAGVQILAPNGPTPCLYVSVNIAAGTGPSAGMIAFAIATSLEQSVKLERNGLALFAPTWKLKSVSTIGADNIRMVRGYVVDLVDTFINDWLSVNPKR